MSRQDMTRRGFLRALGCGSMLLGAKPLGGILAGQAARKPNFVLILVDDMGWADTGCYGSHYYETPNIDKLASQGMRFTNAYAACAVCSPTRASIMTGRYPARLGVTDWIRSRFQGGQIPADKKNPTAYVGGKNQKLLCPPNALWMELEEVTIAEALKPAGYVTCHIGKWHLGTDDWYPDKQGFDYNIGGCDYGQPPTYFDPYFRKGQGDIPTLPPRRTGEYLTDREANEAVRFIREAMFWHFPHYRGADVVPYSILRAGDWKLIKRYEGRTFELFNLTYDPAEQTDLSEAVPEKVRELDARLQAWLVRTRAKLPIPNQDYEPAASRAGGAK